MEILCSQIFQGGMTGEQPVVVFCVGAHKKDAVKTMDVCMATAREKCRRGILLWTVQYDITRIRWWVIHVCIEFFHTSDQSHDYRKWSACYCLQWCFLLEFWVIWKEQRCQFLRISKDQAVSDWACVNSARNVGIVFMQVVFVLSAS